VSSDRFQSRGQTWRQAAAHAEAAFQAAPAWAYREKCQRENREAWRTCHLDQAARIEQVAVMASCPYTPFLSLERTQWQRR
jgi:hypothetical protein